MKSKGKNYFVYAVSSFVMVFALSVGIVATGSYDKMKNIESQIRRMEIESKDSDVEVFYNSADVKNDDKTNSTEKINECRLRTKKELKNGVRKMSDYRKRRRKNGR